MHLETKRLVTWCYYKNWTFHSHFRLAINHIELASTREQPRALPYQLFVHIACRCCCVLEPEWFRNHCPKSPTCSFYLDNSNPKLRSVTLMQLASASQSLSFKRSYNDSPRRVTVRGTPLCVENYINFADSFFFSLKIKWSVIVPLRQFYNE